MSFLIKHHLLHVLRQRQQRVVAEENSHCFQILLKALPIADDECEEESDRSSTVAMEDLASEITKNGSKGNTSRKRDNQVKVSSGKEKNHKHSGRSNIGSNSALTKRDPSPSCKTVDSKNSAITSSNNSSSSSNGPAAGSNFSGIKITPRIHEDTLTHSLNSTHSISSSNSSSSSNSGGSSSGMCNGDLVRPSSSTKQQQGQPPSGKKQALVKAVPRTDLQQQTEAREKVRSNNNCNRYKVLLQGLPPSFIFFI